MVKKVRSVPGPGVPKDEISRIIDVHLQGVHQRALEAIAGFSGPYQSEDGGHEYYYNEITKVSTWESPVTEWEHNISTRYMMEEVIMKICCCCIHLDEEHCERSFRIAKRVYKR